MCGILLAIGPAVSELSAAFAAALDTLSHRGPDGHGILESRNLILGHRRLSIIDLSDAASQPMINDRGNVIVFNGEIYNYLELRKDLVSLGCTFTTSSDTEVLLRSYETWGADCVRRFNGMWTFCIHDRVANRVFVSRDRFGVKPLYISRIKDALVFASEPKALIALDPSLRAPNERKIARFLAMGEL